MRRRRAIWVQIGLVSAAAAAAVVPTPASLVERLYARGVYPPLQRVLTTMSNLTELALFDGLVVVVVAGLVGLAVARLRRGRRRRLRTAGRIAADLIVAAAVAYLAFLALWGLNYRRLSVRHTVDFDATRVNAASLERTLDLATRELNRLSPAAHADDWPPLAAVPDRLGAAFAAAQADLGHGRAAVPGRPKRTLLSYYFVRAAIDGMTDPFALEVLLNRDVLPFERPFVVAHEWGHLAGYAVESEASFLAWLTCMRGDAQAQYSGWLALFLHLAGDVPPDTYRAAVERLDEAPRANLQAIVRRVTGSVPVVRDTTRRVYDRFLRANRQPSGVRSYDEVVSLIVGTRFDPYFRPVRRPS